MTKSRKDAATDWKNTKESLSHVFWIGGATTAGKSTIATKLADDFSMIHYSIDSQLRKHQGRATEEEYPAVDARAKQGIVTFLRRVLPQPPDIIAEMVRDFHRERLRMVVEDLLAMADDRAVVADVYFGETLGELRQLIDYGKAVFLVPTESFHKAHYKRRFRDQEGWKPLEWVRQALENCPDPETVFMSGWAQHQLNYNHYVREECKKHNLKLLITGGHSSLEESYKAVCDHFHLSG